MIPTLSIIRQTMTERNMASIRKEILTTAKRMSDEGRLALGGKGGEEYV